MRAHSEQETLRIEEEGRMIMIINACEVAPKCRRVVPRTAKKMTSKMSHLSWREWVWSRPLRAGPHPNLLGDGPCHAALQPLRLLQGQHQNQLILRSANPKVFARWCKNTRGRWFSDSGDCSTAAPKDQVRAYTSDVNLVFLFILLHRYLRLGQKINR